MKRAAVLIISICLILTACGKPEARTFKRVYLAPYSSVMVYTKSPVNVIPRGIYRAIEADDEQSSDLYAGVDPDDIPVGTILFLHDIGFRVAIRDSRAKDRSIIVYSDIGVDEVFIWAITKAVLKDEDKQVPGLAEV